MQARREEEEPEKEFLELLESRRLAELQAWIEGQEEAGRGSGGQGGEVAQEMKEEEENEFEEG